MQKPPSKLYLVNAEREIDNQANSECSADFFRATYYEANMQLRLLSIPVRCSSGTPLQVTHFVEAAKAVSRLCEHEHSQSHPLKVLMWCQNYLLGELRSENKHPPEFCEMCIGESLALKAYMNKLCVRTDNRKITIL